MFNFQLTAEEHFFINTYRYFEFLRLKGYTGKEFSLGTRGTKYVSFYNPLKSQTISIIEREDGSLDFVIQRKGFLKKPTSFYELTKTRVNGFKYLSQAVKSNKSLMESI